MERSNREIALTLALQYTQGRTDHDNPVEGPFGPEYRYLPATVAEQLQNAEKYLMFLEGDEVTD